MNLWHLYLQLLLTNKIQTRGVLRPIIPQVYTPGDCIFCFDRLLHLSEYSNFYECLFVGCGLCSIGYYTSLWHQVDWEEWVICIFEDSVVYIDDALYNNVNNSDYNNGCISVESEQPFNISNAIKENYIAAMLQSNPIMNVYAYASWLMRRIWRNSLNFEWHISL
jgi:hypothetical protein